MKALNRNLTRARNLRRPSLRVQLTVLYTGLLLAVLAAALLATNLLYGHAAAAAPGSRPGAPNVATGPVVASSHFDIGPAFIGLTAAMIAAAGAWWLAGLFLRPLNEMTSTAQEISATDLGRRLDFRGPDDELTTLAKTLDDLFERLGNSFEAQRHFVANASHELRTPLAGQRTLLQVALADPDADAQTLRTTCEEALALSGHQERLIDALLTLATSEQGVKIWEPIDLAALARDLVPSFHEHAARRAVQVHAMFNEATAVGDPSLLRSLMTNLVDNALRHNHPGGRVEVATTSRDGRAVLSFSNTGPIIPSDQVIRLLQPFQRLGQERVGGNSGHGLGLAVVSAIAAAHGARLSVRPRPGGGLNIEVSFAAPPHPAATAL
jgi:signal transduction histidine kinase